MRPIYLRPDGDVGTAILEAMAERLTFAFAAPVMRGAPFDANIAFDTRRGQYDALILLRHLIETVPEDAALVLGITERDLFIPALTFVFGLAKLDGKAAVMSVARLRPEFYGAAADPQLVTSRALKEGLHELGHSRGLIHCPDSTCAMSLSTSIEQVDGKRPGFCSICAVQLVKRGAVRTARRRNGK